MRAIALFAALAVLPAAANLPPLPEPSAAERELLGVRFVLTSVRIDGATSLPGPARDAVIADYTGRTLGAGDLREIAARLTRIYTDRGYATSGVVFRSADAATGEAIFEAVEGRITQVRFVVPPKIANAGWLTRQLVPDPEAPARLGDLQERMAVLRDTRVVDRINASVEPLPTLGESEMVVFVEEPRPWSLIVEYDNYHSPVVGANGPSVGFQYRNLTGWGDQLDLLVEKTSGLDDVKAAWLGSIPATQLLVGLRYEHTNALAVDPPAFRALDIKSVAEIKGVGFGWQFLTRPSTNVQARLAYERSSSETTLLGLPFSFTPGLPDGRASIDAVRASVLVTERGEADVAFLRVQASRGRVTSPLEDVEFAPSARYTSALVQAQYARLLTEGGAQALLRFEGQYSPDILLPIERYSLGGQSTLRGYRENVLLRDRGVLASVEVRAPVWRWSDVARLELGVFAEGAWAQNVRGGPDVLPSSLATAGVSIIATGPWGLFARVDLARPSNRWITPNADLQDRGIFFQVAWSSDRIFR